MKMKMKNRSHRYHINRPSSRHAHIYKKPKQPTPKQYLKLNS